MDRTMIDEESMAAAPHEYDTEAEILARNRAHTAALAAPFLLAMASCEHEWIQVSGLDGGGIYCHKCRVLLDADGPLPCPPR